MNSEQQAIVNAISFLENPRQWSADFENIRWHLISWLGNEQINPCLAAVDLANALLDGPSE